jgi:hypothetical protein
MKAFYFANTDRRLRFGDNRKIHLGETHTIEGKPIMRERGLHASKKILNVLDYAPGPVIYIVDVSAEIVENGIICSKFRTYLKGDIDISHILCKFARMCLLDVIDLQETPNIIIRYLKTGDESLTEDIKITKWNDGLLIRSALLAIIIHGKKNPTDIASVVSQIVLGDIRNNEDTSFRTSESAIIRHNLARDFAKEKQEQRLSRMVMRAIRKQEKQND